MCFKSLNQIFCGDWDIVIGQTKVKKNVFILFVMYIKKCDTETGLFVIVFFQNKTRQSKRNICGDLEGVVI